MENRIISSKIWKAFDCVAVGALVAGAGILGAALGFGAQSLVRDLISGLFIVVEQNGYSLLNVFR